MQIWAETRFNVTYFDQVPDLDWDAAVQAANSHNLAAEDPAAYYQVLGELTALLKDGHAVR